MVTDQAGHDPLCPYRPDDHTTWCHCDLIRRARVEEQAHARAVADVDAALSLLYPMVRTAVLLDAVRVLTDRGLLHSAAVIRDHLEHTAAAHTPDTTPGGAVIPLPYNGRTPGTDQVPGVPRIE